MQALKCDSFNYSFKKCDVMFIFLYHNWPSLSRDRQKLTIMNHCCYYFDGLCKVKTKYIILCLNALLNYRTWGEHLAPQLWWTTGELVVICLGPISPVNGFLSVRFMWCEGHEILWHWETCLLRRKLTWNVWR